MANESASAARFVTDVLARCAAHGFKSVQFFVVIDRASTDDTLQQIRALAVDQLSVRPIWAPDNRTVVDAYVRGYREAVLAGCDWILEIDAGFSHQPSDIPQFFARMQEGYACVFGSRFGRDGRFEGPLGRYLISRGGTILTNLVVGTRLTDMTSGFELFSRAALERVLARGVRSRGPFFQTEIKAYCHDLRVVEVPIHYRAPTHSLGSASLADAFVSLWRLFRLRLAGRL
jgi:dolichol-phosphate mannosyltransferase